TATGDGKLVVSGYLYDEVLNDYDIVMAKYYINESLSLHNPNDVSIQLFPNPVSETLYVRMKNEATAENFKVTDMSGKVVLNGKLSLEQGIHVSALARGVYFISLDGYNPIRFIKQ
ncbi:MAG: T9SS type A sorting domain-containing protein, partial [Flavobacterium sp.]